MRIARVLLLGAELVILTTIVLAARCANYGEVFVSGNIYFTDADCYARMTRVRLCAAHPGLVLRHHHFENFPQGTTPHTTAPLDYAILGLSILLRPFTSHAMDLAGALISPLLALIGGWFLWWWSRQMQFRFRWSLLLLYAVSPIIVHAAELGRPDHQSLVLTLVVIAICAEWILQRAPSRGWSATSGASWAMAIWISAYEPLVLLAVTVLVLLVQDRHLLLRKDRRIGWVCFAVVIATAFLIERRIPSFGIVHPSGLFRNWAATIGELRAVSPVDAVWLRWSGYIIVAAPVLLWFGYGKRSLPPLSLLVLLFVSWCLTMAQARWACYFLAIFVLLLPALLEPIRSRTLVWSAFALSMFPLMQAWDERLWPNESELARRTEHRREQLELRQLATDMMSAEVRPFLAPWWLSPAIVYWSGQPGVAGSSHESLPGIAASARFFVAQDHARAGQIVQQLGVTWVVAYDSERVAANCVAILGTAIPPNPLCRSLDRTPAQAPPFLQLVSQNSTAKLFEVANNR